MMTYSIKLIGLLTEQILVKRVRIVVLVFQPIRDIVIGIFSPFSRKFVRQGELFTALEVGQDFFFIEAGVLINKLLFDLFLFNGILFENLIKAITHHEVRLSNHPVAGARIRHHLVVVDGHVTNQFVLLLSHFLGSRVGLIHLGLDVAESLLETDSLSLKLFFEVICQGVLQEQPTSHGINGFSVEFFHFF